MKDMVAMLTDPERDRLCDWLAMLDIVELSRRLARQALEFVLDRKNTYRVHFLQLDKQEKAFIGKKFESLLKQRLCTQSGQKLDCQAYGFEWEIKFTVGDNWMIPPEVLRANGLCLLVQANPITRRFAVGVVRVGPHMVINGANRDGKLKVSASGKETIKWLDRSEFEWEP